MSPPRTGAAGVPAPYQAPLFSKLLNAEQALIDLAMGALQTPEVLADARVSLQDAIGMFPRHGYAPLGAPALREAIASCLTRAGRAGPTDPRQVLVTAGGQGALSLIAAGLIKPGDRVLVEAPTYPGAIEIFSRMGARIEAIERDHAGVIAGQLEDALRAGPARLLYLVPTCHNPTGTTMSERRRHEVLRVAADWRLVTVEDTALADLADDPPPDLSAITAERVISIGSLSKCYWPGLRVGWVRAAPEMVQRLGRLRASVDLGGPVLDQAAAVHVFNDFERATAPVRAAARERLTLLVGRLRLRLPDWEFDEPSGGWSVWAALPLGERRALRPVRAPARRVHRDRRADGSGRSLQRSRATQRGAVAPRDRPRRRPAGARVGADGCQDQRERRGDHAASLSETPAGGSHGPLW